MSLAGALGFIFRGGDPTEVLQAHGPGPALRAVNSSGGHDESHVMAETGEEAVSLAVVSDSVLAGQRASRKVISLKVS